MANLGVFVWPPNRAVRLEGGRVVKKVFQGCLTSHYCHGWSYSFGTAVDVSGSHLCRKEGGAAAAA